LWLPVTCTPLLQPCSGARRRHVVEHRRRHRTEVDDVDPGRHQAADQRRGEAGSGMAAVAADRDRAFARGQRLAAEGATEVLRELLVDRLVDDAADVVGLEDRSVNLHREEEEERRKEGAGAL
jgi:hypothetical protein